MPLNRSCIDLLSIIVGHNVNCWSLCPVPVLIVRSCLGWEDCGLIWMGMSGIDGNIVKMFLTGRCYAVLYFDHIECGYLSLDLCCN